MTHPFMIGLLVRQAAHSLRTESDFDTARLDVEMLLAHVLKRPRSYVFSHSDAVLSDVQYEAFERALLRRLNGEPIAYIVGECEFWSLMLSVTPAVLIPRPDTEVLVEWVLEQCPETELRVMDAGTGSGAIAIALASERPAWTVCAMDQSMAALRVAQTNLCTHQLDARIQLHQGWWCNAVSDQSLDVLVSNPPYIDACDAHLNQGDVRFEPRSALVADAHGLADIHIIAAQARRVLKPNAILVLEHGWQQSADVRSVLQTNGFKSCASVNDLAGHERMTVGFNPT
ncbi:MAG: peptide chain release factor N(5)-glutamine methyltransferase [Pseudomonadota bacterium]